jgi:ComF family protein
MPFTNNHLLEENEITDIFAGRLNLQAACALFYYHSGSKYHRLLHDLKYKSKKEIGVELGRLLGYNIKESPFFDQIDFIVPVPLHPKKKLLRGYNQSMCIAKGISEITGIPADDNTLIRNVNTETQTKKSRIERWENVSNIFELKSDKFKNKHLLIVDDVITTGSTIEACAIKLQEQNSKISVASLAVAKNI